MLINLDTYSNEIHSNPDLKILYTLSLHLQSYRFEGLNGNAKVIECLKKQVDTLNNKIKKEFMEIKDGNYSSFIKEEKKKVKKIKPTQSARVPKK